MKPLPFHFKGEPFSPFKFLTIVKGDTPTTMDPLTAINNGITAFFNFCSTPVGQNILEDIRKIDQALFSKVGDLFTHLHNQVHKLNPPA